MKDNVNIKLMSNRQKCCNLIILVIVDVLLPVFASLPAFILVFKILPTAYGDLDGSDPKLNEAMHIAKFKAHHISGEWALRCLLLSLAITPLRWVLKSIESNVSHAIFPLRKTFGVLSFFYSVLHVVIFYLFDIQRDLSLARIQDIVDEKPHIIPGMVAFFLLIPLAVTSFKACQTRLGKYWMQLHMLVYIIAILSVVHLLKVAEYREHHPVEYEHTEGVNSIPYILTAFLGFRIVKYLFCRKSKTN